MTSTLGFVILASFPAYGAELQHTDCDNKETTVVLHASLITGTSIRLTIKNCTNVRQEFLAGQFRPPFLRLFVVDRFGDPLKKHSWTGDKTDSSINLGPGDVDSISIDLNRWFEGLNEKVSNDCLDLLWSIHFKATNGSEPVFAGGALQLSCQR